MHTGHKWMAPILLTLFLLAGSASAVVRYVPDEYPTIQAGPDAAQSGETVLVAPGTYYENITWPNRDGIRRRHTGAIESAFDEEVVLKWHTRGSQVPDYGLGYGDRVPYYGAARFTPDVGYVLSRVRWGQHGDAATAHVFVWDEGTVDAPGAVIEEWLVSTTGENQWHEVSIPGNHSLPAGRDFWVGVRLADYQVSGGRYPLSADRGPQVPPPASFYVKRDVTGGAWSHLIPPPDVYDRNWLIEAVVELQTGAEDLPGRAAPAARLTISPNPLAGGLATLRLEGLGHNPESRKDSGYVPRLTVSVYDVTGRSVFRQSAIGNQQSVMSLDLRALSSGVYLVKVEADGFNGTQKLVVQQ